MLVVTGDWHPGLGGVNPMHSIDPESGPHSPNNITKTSRLPWICLEKMRPGKVNQHMFSQMVIGFMVAIYYGIESLKNQLFKKKQTQVTAVFFFQPQNRKHFPTSICFP